MGVELTRDNEGNSNLELINEYFNKEENIDEDLEDYDTLKIIGRGDNDDSLTKKIISKINNKVYVMKEIRIDNNLLQRNDRINLINILNILKDNECPNIIKNYKFYIKDNIFYIINEYLKNGDLLDYMKLNKSLDKPIEEEKLWDIFMQCATSLKFMHDKNIIHRNIRLENIYMTENGLIKFGNFRKAILIKKDNESENENDEEERLDDQVGGMLYRSPEMINKLGYWKKTDIYSLGVVFHKLCFYEFPKRDNADNNKINNVNNINIPDEIVNIIKLMLNEEKDRPDANLLYDLISKEYAKKVPRNTSIEAIFRCLNSFNNFSTYMIENKNDFLNEEKTPFCYNFIKCIEEYDDKAKLSLYINNFRNIKNNIFGQIYNKSEIKPSMVLQYLLEQINKENKEINNNLLDASLKAQPNEFELIEENAKKNFLKFYNKNSIISQYFCGILETERICKCQTKSYYYSSFPYLEFQLDRCASLNQSNRYAHEKDVEKWFVIQQNHKHKLSKKYNITCKNCLFVEEQIESKIFKKLPLNLIISINRGENYENKSKVEYSLNIILSGKIYGLIGVIKRIKNEKEEYFISINLDYKEKMWFMSDKNSFETTKIDSPLNHSDGEVIMLFYSLNNN